MMRDVLIGTVTGISAVVAMSLLTPRPPAPPPAIRSLPAFGHDDLALPLTPTTRPDPARARLETVIEKLVSRGSGVGDVLSYIASASGANMVVNWRALEAAGIAGDAPVTLDLRKLPARVVLTQVLSQVGGGTIKLSYRVVDGIVLVSTADDLDRYTVTRVYDVRDLIAREANWVGTTKRGKKPTDEEEAMEALVRLVQETVDPTVWRNAGGSVGGIRAFYGKLIITGTPELHERTVELLRRLRGSP